jgi:hypothetical protein
VFDANQFREINESVDAIVFPGIEVNLEDGHVLIISDSSDLDDFEAKTAQVAHILPSSKLDWPKQEYLERRYQKFRKAV